jgi:hypothetical protein
VATIMGESLDHTTNYDTFLNNFGFVCDLMAILCFIYAFVFLFTNVHLKTFKKIEKDADPIFEKLNQEILRKMSHFVDEQPVFVQIKEEINKGTVNESKSKESYMNNDSNKNKDENFKLEIE